MSSFFKRKKTVFISLLIFLLILGASGYAFLHFFFEAPILKHNKDQVIFIDTNDNIDSVYVKLEHALNQPIPKGFKVLVNNKEYANHIKAGKYKITTNDTNKSLFTKLWKGYETPTRLVFNNIRTKEQLAGKLSKQIQLDSLEIITAFNDTSLLSQYGYTPETITALFIPNTYEVYWATSMKDLIQRFKREHAVFWNIDRLNKADSIGFTPLEISIIASIVEEETSIADEKPIVAGLYINRVKQGIPLQADPTLKFALNNFTIKRLLDVDKKVDSPYNTYMNSGLPPGPIRIPSIEGIESVLNFEQHNYLYMCAKEDFSGRHNFATNLRDHNNNSIRYRKELNRRRIYR